MDLTPVSSFDDVYQLEKTDRVLGGAGAISNEQAQQLTNRTEWLKDALVALDGSGGPFDFDASGGVVPAVGSGSGGSIKRKDNYRVSVPGTVSGVILQVGDTLIARQDAPTLLTQYIILQNNVDLATATVFGLVKLAQDLSGGGTADKTLSTSGLISLFAQLASPAFSGNPTVPDQAALNNSGRIANTKYVDAAVAVEAGNRASAVSGEASARTIADSTLQSNIDAIDPSLVAWTQAGVTPGSGMTLTASFGIRKMRDGNIQMKGSLSHSGVMPVGQVLFNLPAGYRPANGVMLPVGSFNFLAGPGWQVSIDTAGDVHLWESGTLSGNMSISTVSVDGCSFSTV